MHTSRPISELRRALATGELSARELVENALTTAVWRKTQGAKTYLHLDPDAVRAQLNAGLDLTKPLGGLPVSVKDCFDVAGVPTTAGSSFYAGTRPVPEADAEYVAIHRAAGAALMGKTHLNEFAYGITGENLHFGDCEIPTRPGCLTGGSSSGAAASVVEGSAVIGLGTDTGGSLRAPASFCGLVSFRASLERGKWRGCLPLAPSFDTMGWLCRHLADMPAIGHALLGVDADSIDPKRTRIGVAAGKWLEVCDPEIVAAQRDYAAKLRDAGFLIEEFDASLWLDATSIFIPLQAHEAHAIHRGFLAEFADRYEPGVRSRLEFGGTISQTAYHALKARQMEFCAASLALFERFDFVIAPVTPIRELRMGQDHSEFRPRILKVTAPVSLNGWPALTVRSRGTGPEDLNAHGFGLQVVAPGMLDGKLLGLAAALANSRLS
jgi:Asp-tRNA(Asn)/Glu-tRNA(Gln) amidotransferase A subunit family amidase